MDWPAEAPCLSDGTTFAEKALERAGAVVNAGCLSKAPLLESDSNGFAAYRGFDKSVEASRRGPQVDALWDALGFFAGR